MCHAPLHAPRPASRRRQQRRRPKAHLLQSLQQQQEQPMTRQGRREARRHAGACGSGTCCRRCARCGSCWTLRPACWACWPPSRLSTHYWSACVPPVLLACLAVRPGPPEQVPPPVARQLPRSWLRRRLRGRQGGLQLAATLSWRGLTWRRLSWRWRCCCASRRMQVGAPATPAGRAPPRARQGRSHLLACSYRTAAAYRPALPFVTATRLAVVRHFTSML